MTTQKTSKRGEFNPNWPVPDKYLLELGRMVSVWGSLESTTAVAISKLAGYESPTDICALAMVAHSNFQQRVDIASSLCWQLVDQVPHLNVDNNIRDRHPYRPNGRIVTSLLN